ncbi:MAG TPA: Spy/CpxP family protein refolding chaperone [Polyangiaceae bacterium]|nr:Spy/CpxP family protein refolding chaperone [Polyangiaceae bacterium]
MFFFGPFVGAAALFGLGMFAARRRFRHHGFGHHHDGFGGHRGPGHFRRRALRHVLERLDTTPGQEKVILSAIEDLTDRAADAREGLAGTRKAVAEAIRGEHVDAQTFGALFDEHVTKIEQLRDEAARAAATIHESLTPDQREELARLVESGRRFRRGAYL